MICALTPTWWYLTYQQSWQWGRWAPWLVDFPQATRRRRAPRESAQLRSPGRATPEKGLSLKSRVKMFYRRGCPFDEVPVAVQGHQHHREVLQEPHHLIVMACCRAFSDLSWSSSYLFSVGIVHLHLGLEDVSVLHTAHREEVVNGRTQQFNLKANLKAT